jgi:signal transduction histidine kinase
VRRRILATIVIVTTIAVTAVFIPAALAIRGRIQRGDLLELQREAAVVANEVPPAGPIDMDALAELIDDAHNLSLYDELGRLVSGTGPATADRPVELALQGSFAEGYVGDELVAAVPVRVGPFGIELAVRIGEPRSESRALVNRALARLAAVALVIVAVAAAAGWLLARRLSRPIEQLQHVASALGEGRLDGPAPQTGIAEFDELAVTLDDSRAKISELLARERAFSSHVSHQLRTPVAAMRVAIETELTAPRPDASAVLHESIGALDRLESTITSLLELARHDVGTAVAVDLLARAQAGGERWEPIFARTQRALRVSGSSAGALVVPAAVDHIVDVLVDNALQHGRGTVEIVVARDESRSRVEVRDEGAIDENADPFSERRTDSGHGIGLRLARTIAESEGGVLFLGCRVPTTFTVTFPAIHVEPAARVQSSSPDE